MVLVPQERHKMANDISILRFTSGETVIGKVTKQTETHITMVKPALVFTQRDPATGNQQVGLAPLAPFSKGEKVDILLSSCQFCSEASNQLVDNYIKATTNIDVVRGPGLILES